MPESFVPFEIAFAPLPARVADPAPAGISAADGSEAKSAATECAGLAPPDLDEALAEVRRFRAALADALDAQLSQLVCDVACEVLGRDLQLAAADVAAIARDALERFAADVPLRLRAHPHDAGSLASLELPVVADAALRRGDLAIELRSGTIDASLGARLEALLASR